MFCVFLFFFLNINELYCQPEQYNTQDNSIITCFQMTVIPTVIRFYKIQKTKTKTKTTSKGRKIFVEQKMEKKKQTNNMKSFSATQHMVVTVQRKQKYFPSDFVCSSENFSKEHDFIKTFEYVFNT